MSLKGNAEGSFVVRGKLTSVDYLLITAYGVAVQNGFEGTQEEWLESLEGLSAYEIALKCGFEGTEQEWLDSLKGKTPVKGVDYWTAEEQTEIVNTAKAGAEEAAGLAQEAQRMAAIEAGNARSAAINAANDAAQRAAAEAASLAAGQAANETANQLSGQMSGYVNEAGRLAQNAFISERNAEQSAGDAQRYAAQAEGVKIAVDEEIAGLEERVEAIVTEVLEEVGGDVIPVTDLSAAVRQVVEGDPVAFNAHNGSMILSSTTPNDAVFTDRTDAPRYLIPVPANADSITVKTTDEKVTLMQFIGVKGGNRVFGSERVADRTYKFEKGTADYIAINMIYEDTGAVTVPWDYDVTATTTVTFSLASDACALPAVTDADEGKILQVVAGKWTAVALADSAVKTYIDDYINEALGGEY